MNHSNVSPPWSRVDRLTYLFHLKSVEKPKWKFSAANYDIFSISSIHAFFTRLREFLLLILILPEILTCSVHFIASFVNKINCFFMQWTTDNNLTYEPQF